MADSRIISRRLTILISYQKPAKILDWIPVLNLETWLLSKTKCGIDRRFCTEDINFSYNIFCIATIYSYFAYYIQACAYYACLNTFLATHLKDENRNTSMMQSIDGKHGPIYNQECTRNDFKRQGLETIWHSLFHSEGDIIGIRQLKVLSEC